VTTAEEACRQGKVISQPHPFLTVAAPIFVRGSSPQALVLFAVPGQIESACNISVVAATHVTLAQLLADFAELGETVRSSAAMLELLERVDSAESVDQACGELVDQLCSHLECSRVAIGLRRGPGPYKLSALSGASQFDRHSEFSRAVEAAIDEAILRNEPTQYPPQDPSQRHALRAHQRLANLAGMDCALSLPLVDRLGQPAGVWVFLGDQKLASPSSVCFLETLAPVVWRSLDLLRRTGPAVVLRRANKLLRARKSWLLVPVGLLLLGMLFLPMKYRVACECELQPTTRRYVAAPYDGKLAQVLVGPGDVVAANQPLAQLDGREIQWELDGVTVDQGKSRKTHDVALAKHKVADAQLARLETDRLELRRRLLEHRIQNLEIRSPISGVVLSGDLERTEGAPLTLGQTLFEIAPLGQMVVELAIPESEIAHVQQGDLVRLSLDAYPHSQWSGTVKKIHPRAKLIDKQSVFVAEVPLDNSPGRLRPGMKGSAKIVGRRHPLI
jgi:hypothetical protein